ncbi:MAG: hypothetical protein ACP5UA_06610 [Candidatus Hydrogenedens sp.]
MFVKKKTNRYVIFLLLLTFIALLSIDGWSAAKKKKKVEDEVPQPRSSPWVLRHRYTFSWENMGIDFDEMNGDWHIFYTVPDNYSEMTIIEGYGPSIQLKTGEEISAESLGNAFTDRVAVDSVFGPATHFTAIFPIKNDILIQQRVTSFKQCSFVLFSTLITNNGTSPITIAKIKPFVFPPVAGLITRLPNEKIRRPVGNINGYWAYTSEEESQILELTTNKGQKIVFAVCPQGKSHSKIFTEGDGDNWTGAVECEYLPSLTIAAGETIESDPVLVSFSNDAYKLHTTFIWALSSLSPTYSKMVIEKPVRGWISVDPGKVNLGNLSKIASFSSSVGINAILIPNGWEQPLGSLKGNTKTLSKDMKPIIEQLKNHSALKVGLSLNPWVVPVGSEFSVPVSDEYAFVRFNTPNGLEVAKKRWEKILSWNPDFIVCDISVPDTVLEQIHATYTEAMFQGLKELSNYFSNIPVYPKSSEVIINSEQELTAFCAISGTLSSFNTGISPVKINNQLVNTQNFLTNTFLQSFPGPAVWLGDFNNSDVAKKMLQLTIKTKVMFTPFDTNKKQPSVWYYRSYATQDSFNNSLIYIIKNVEPFSASLLKSINNEALFWDYAREKFIEDSETIQGNPEEKYIGLIVKTDIPSVVGVKTADQCGMEFINSTRWINEEKKLEVLFKETITSPATLYIYKPESYKINRVLIDGKSLKSVKLSSNIVSISIKSTPERVELIVD